MDNLKMGGIFCGLFVLACALALVFYNPFKAKPKPKQTKIYISNFTPFDIQVKIVSGQEHFVTEQQSNKNLMKRADELDISAKIEAKTFAGGGSIEAGYKSKQDKEDATEASRKWTRILETHGFNTVVSGTFSEPQHIPNQIGKLTVAYQGRFLTNMKSINLEGIPENQEQHLVVYVQPNYKTTKTFRKFYRQDQYGWVSFYESLDQYQKDTGFGFAKKLETGDRILGQHKGNNKLNKIFGINFWDNGDSYYGTWQAQEAQDGKNKQDGVYYCADGIKTQWRNGKKISN